MLKNKLFASAFALALVLGGASIASAYSFPSVIDTKQEKMDVQTVLNMTTGSTLTVDGVLGAKSIAAVKAFQTMKGLVADGLIGPMTRAALEAASVGGSTVSTVAGCSAGAAYSATTGAACTTTVTSTVAGCAAGAAFSATTGAACGTTTVVTPGTTMTGSTDGSLTMATSSYVSSGIQIKKGETKDVAAVRLQAVAGPVKVSYVDVQFNVRPWLFFGALTLHDSTGKVIATKTLTSIADTTEITVGTLYQVRFDGLNFVVTPGTNVDLAVGASVLAATDKIPSIGQNVQVGIVDMRTISEVGYSNTASFPFASGNTVSLTSTGSVANLYSRISPNSPAAGQQVVSTTQTTTNVVLGTISVKSANNSSTLNTLTVNMVGTGNAATPSAAFSNVRLFVNGSSVAGGVICTASLVSTTSCTLNSVTFSNMTVALAQDSWMDLVVEADINQVAVNSTGTIYVQMLPSTTNPMITDSNYGTPLIITGTNPTSNILTLTTNSLNVSAINANLGSAIVQGNSTVGYNATYAFTLTNSSNNDLFVSATPGTFLTMTGAVSGTALSNVTVSPSTVNGDVAGVSYAIPAGTSRTFNFSAAIRGAATTSTTFAVSAINYHTTAALTGISDVAGVINTGLSSLTLTASF